MKNCKTHKFIGGGTLLAILRMTYLFITSENYEWYWHCGKIY